MELCGAVLESATCYNSRVVLPLGIKLSMLPCVTAQKLYKYGGDSKRGLHWPGFHKPTSG